VTLRLTGTSEADKSLYSLQARQKIPSFSKDRCSNGEIEISLCPRLKNVAKEVISLQKYQPAPI